jgi:hypothetical protein
VRNLLADGGCCRAVLDFLSTTDVGRRVPPPAEEDVLSETSEWELRERSERDEERRQEAEVRDAEVEEPLFLPRPPSWHPQKRSRKRGPLSFCSSFCYFFGAISIFMGQARAEGKGKLATCRHRADSGQKSAPP